MKVEQACRSRLDEGYCVFAKSAGLNPTQEESLGDVFNSTMNTIFPKMGASILSCIPQGNNAFLARNTLRTDVLGRKTIFTHAYVFSAEEYARVMREEPQLLLEIPMDRMLDSQTPGAQMEQLELTAPASPAMTVEALFEKYDLNPVRYSRLLLGAYEAMTSNGSLRLKTNLPLEQTEQMVRELTCCILDGLLPVLKGKVSFSSGADTRMKISVMAAGDNSAQPSDIIFGVEDDSATNIRAKDEISAMAFDALGRAGHSQRRQMLQQMQDWLSEVTNVQEGLSVMLVSAAYCLSSGQSLNQDTLLMLFRNITTASKGFSNFVINSLLTDILRQINALGPCSPKALSQVAGWYLRESSPAFREEADRSLSEAPAEICAALVEAVFNQTMSDNVRQMLDLLLRRLPPDSGMLPPQVQSQVVLWILSENVEKFTDYAAVLMMNYNDQQMLQLAQGILAGSRERSLTTSEDVMLAKALRRLTAVQAALSEEESALLDGHSSRYSEDLMSAALDHLFQVRLASMELSQGLALLETLSATQPQFFVRIVEELTSGRRNTGDLWEHYQAQHCFYSGMTSEDITQVCQNCNTFDNPNGIFEQTAAQYWLKLAEAEFASYSKRDTQLQYFFEILAVRWLQRTSLLKLSPAAQKTVARQIVDSVWSTITFTQIYANEYAVPESLKIVTEQSRLKIRIFNLCLNLHKNPRDTQQLIDWIQAEDTEEAEWNELKTCAGSMMFALLKRHKYLSWDLVLLSCWTRTEKGSTADLEQFQEQCQRLDKFFEMQSVEFLRTPADSLLLRNEKLAKAICKLNSDDSPILQELTEQLKPEKKGFLGGIFSGGQPKEHAPEPQRREKQKGKVFDPTDTSGFETPDRNEKKGKGLFRR